MDYNEEYLEWFRHMLSTGNIMQEVLFSTVIGIIFTVFIKDFVPKRRFHAFVSGVLYGILIFIFYRIPNSVTLPRGLASAFSMVYGFILLYLPERKRPLQKVFLSCTYYTLFALCMGFTSEQNMYFYDFIMSTSFFNLTVERSLIAYFLSLFEDVAVFGAVLFLSVSFLRKYIRYKDEEISVRDLLLLLLPPVLRYTNGQLYVEYQALYADYFNLLYDTGNTETLSRISLQSYVRIIDYGIFILFYLVFIWCYFDIKRVQRESIDAAILNEQTRQLKKRLQRIEDKNEKMSAFRHDMSHHYEVISLLLSEGQYEEAREYTGELGRSIKELKSPVSTGNPVTDIILSEAMSDAMELGADFSSEFVYPKDFGFDVFDISAILGNGLSNAIRGCRACTGGKSFIAIRSIIKGNAFLLEIRNSFDGVFTPDRDTGLPRSTKGSSHHGMGLLNIRTISGKYGGDMTIEHKDGVVCLSVILQKGKKKW